MLSIVEAQTFVEQFDKCLPLCERGDAVSVVNALHTLNFITQASINQAKELDPANERDYFCSFLLELELAIELFICPARKLGTIDGGLPALYSFSEEDIASLSALPSKMTKFTIRRFLLALGVNPSSNFENRGIAEVTREFIRLQVKKSDVEHVQQPTHTHVIDASSRRTLKPAKSTSISWANQCNSSDSDFEDMPPLEDGDDDVKPECKSSTLGTRVCISVQDTVETDGEDQESEEDERSMWNEAAYTFLFSQPFHRQFECDDHDAPMGLSKPTSEEYYGLSLRSTVARPDHYYKTRMCKNWELNGSCQYGARCNFAHGTEELRHTNTSPATQAFNQDRDTSDRAPKPYKTRMCMNFGQTGACKFGDKCSFAHSKNELVRQNGVTAASPSSSGRGPVKR